jgi:hypothetical protein
MTPIVSNIILANLLKLSENDVSHKNSKSNEIYLVEKTCKRDRTIVDRFESL